MTEIETNFRYEIINKLLDITGRIKNTKKNKNVVHYLLAYYIHNFLNKFSFNFSHWKYYVQYYNQR